MSCDNQTTKSLIMHRIFTLALATGLSLGLWSCGTNNSTSSENTTSTSIVKEDTNVEVEQEATSPADLVLLSAMSARLQNNLSELAETKAPSTEIQELGKEMKQQSSEVLVKIENLMEATDVNNVPQALSVPQQATYDSVSALSNTDFAQAYISTMQRDIRENINNLEGLAATADSEIIRGLAADIIDLQQTELERIETAQNDM